MSSRLVSAFNTVISAQSRPVEIERFGEFAPLEIRIANSNYTRNLASIEEITITGMEFLIPVSQIVDTDYNPPKRGDILRDVDFGENTISFIKPLVIMGNIAGYRVRTE
ncbi:MAG: hypothetical protein KAG61_12370 [Bacteriovoracaceae bacterium]|nr:hypothetical protein [Bacteriovoracaceae bacterium]